MRFRGTGANYLDLKTAGSNIKAEATLDGSSYSSGTSRGTAVMDDGNWHHIAAIFTGSSIVVYVDGVKDIDYTHSFKSTAFASPSIYVGAYGPYTIADHKIDEFAVYPSALSETRILAHYNAVDSVAVTFDAPTVTTSTAAVEPAYVGPKTDAVVDADTAATSSAAYEATVDAQYVYTSALSPTSDYLRSSGTESNTPEMLFDSIGDKAYFLFSLPGEVTNSGLRGVTFRLGMTRSGAAPVLGLQAITAPVTAGVAPTLGATTVAVANTGGAQTLDVSSLVTVPNFYGLALVVTSAPSGANETAYSKEYATTSLRPLLTVNYEIVPEIVDFSADTAVTTASAADAAVETTTEVAVEVATATLSAFEATVDTIITPDADISTETAQASADSYEAEFVQNVVTNLSSPTGAVESYDVTVETTESADVELDTPRILVTQIGLTDVNGQPIVPTEDEDPYFESTMYNNPDIWYRFDDATAPPVPRVYGSAQHDPDRAGSFTGGVVVGQNDGPNGRKYVAFDGTGMFKQYETAGSGSGERFSYNSSLEFSIRTTKDNQFVMRMDDTRLSGGDNFSSFATPRDFYLSDGKLQFKVWTRPGGTGAGVGEIQWTGFTDIADGEWHHIVVVSEEDLDGDVFTGPRMNVYIDGNFELRRRGYGVSFPDYIGGRPISGVYYPAFPQSEWFVGDITEVVQYNERSLNEDRIHIQYDNIFGFQPYYAETAKVTTDGVEASVKSNTKRVLVVGVNSPENRNNWYGHWLRGYMTDIDGQTFGFNNLDSVVPRGTDVNLETAFNAGQYQMFYANATSTRYDERTGEPRLIDLELDINLDDYDVVTLSNLPDDSNDYDAFEKNFGRSALYGGRSARQQIEKMVDDVRDYAIRGGSVWVSDPVFAVSLGVISDVEFVPQIIDPADANAFSVNGTPSKDLRAALINPWGQNSGDLLTANTSADGPATEITPAINRVANYHRDTHGNYLQRVVNTVEGLTDLPGDILVETMESYHPYQRGVLYYAEKWKKRNDGLNVGDEFWIMGTPYGGDVGGADRRTDVTPLDNRTKGYPATPLSAVSAGVPVTTFAAGIWQDATFIPNPYRDYAVTIAVRPGDTINNEVVQGRIFVSFTEGLVEDTTKKRYSRYDVIPPNEEITRPEWREGDYAREWSYSWWRGSWAGGQNLESTPDTVTVEGDTVTITPGQQGISTAPELTHRWPVRGDDAPTIKSRGLTWLTADLDDDGSASVGVETATVSAKAEEATGSGQRSADVTVGTARVITNAYDEADTVSADAEVLVTTPTATVRAEPFTEAVDLSTATATIQAYDDADGVQLSGDWVVLRLPSHSAILTMEDK